MINETEIEEAISKLNEFELVASVRKQESIQIIGGTEKRDAGILSTFKNGFSICNEQGKWVARMPGAGQTSIEKSASTLLKVTELVCDYYSSLPKDFFD